MYEDLEVDIDNCFIELQKLKDTVMDNHCKSMNDYISLSKQISILSKQIESIITNQNKLNSNNK